ncbi:MAG: hypothetical protein JW902_16160 [Syntrophaceae bacterium]|nr:hypothetical protein [Syntrophaceae bacterium]
MNSNLLLSFFIALICATGCNRESTESLITVDQSRSSKVYTEAELNNLIVVGMSIAEVTNKFGLPGSAVNVGENQILLTYMFPFKAKHEQGPYLTGFGIDIKDGRVARWSPVTGMTGKTVEAGGSQTSFGEQSFQVFLATGSLTNVVKTVDTEGIADASNLQASPDLTFKAKVFAGSAGSERPGEKTVILVVSDQDASKLKDFSEDNFGKRLLMVCRKKVIAAPAISAPLASRQLMLTVKNAAVLDSIRSQ